MIAVIAVAMGYLLGSLSGSLLLGQLRGVDIRTQGSGNAGGTNALRTQGWRFALGVVVIDLGKGALAVAVAQLLDGGFALQAGALMAAVLGHVWPLFHGFRGGKGAATLVGGLALFWPQALPVLLAVWLLCVVLTGYVGLATVLAALSLPALAAWQAPAVDDSRWIFALSAAALLIFTHRSNLQRLWRGNEHRFERVRLLHRWLQRRGAS